MHGDSIPRCAPQRWEGSASACVQGAAPLSPQPAGSDRKDLCFVRVPNAAANQWPSVAHDTPRWSVVSPAVRKGRFQAASLAPPKRPLSALDPVTGDASSHPRVHRPLEQAVGPQAGGDRPEPDALPIRPPRSGSLPAPVRTSTLRPYRRRASSPAFRPAGGVPACTAAHRVRLAWRLPVCRPRSATRGPRRHRPALPLPPMRPACAGSA